MSVFYFDLEVISRPRLCGIRDQIYPVVRTHTFELLFGSSDYHTHAGSVIYIHTGRCHFKEVEFIEIPIMVFYPNTTRTSPITIILKLIRNGFVVNVL